MVRRNHCILALVALAAGSLISAPALAANSASGTATATVVTPIAITNSVALAFGKIGLTGAAGTVVVDPAGSRSKTGGVNLVSLGNTTTAASFAVTGLSGASYDVTLPANSTITIGNGTDTMQVDDFTSSLSGSGTLTGGAETVTVGATLKVTGSESVGDYTGNFNVIVNYN